MTLYARLSVLRPFEFSVNKYDSELACTFKINVAGLKKCFCILYSLIKFSAYTNGDYK